jgi:hypothetical protein
MYGGVTMADLPEILDAIERGETVERLAVDPVDFVTDARVTEADKR